MRLGSAIGMRLIIASLLPGCLAPIALNIAQAELDTTEIEKEIRARPVGDPGPIATVAMIPLGGSPAEPVEQADSSRCEINARLTTRRIKDAIPAKLATERYVLCMAGRGSRVM